MRANALSKARECEGNLPVLVDSLVGHFKNRRPPQVITILANYGLQRAVTNEGVSDASLIGIQQHHVELLQAFLLTLSHEAWGEDPVTPDIIQEVINQIVELADAYQIMRLSTLEEEHDEQQHAVLTLQERMRANTQCVRNWGYRTQMFDLSTELYSPLDSRLHGYHGFSATDLIEVIRAIMRVLEERATKRWNLMGEIFDSRSVNQLVHRFFAKYPGIEGNPEEFLCLLPRDVSLNGVKSLLMGFADTELYELFLFDCDCIARVSRRPVEVVRRVLEDLSMRPGELDEHRVQEFFLENPIWMKPGIILQEQFLFPMPQVVFSHIHGLMRTLAKAADLQDRLQKRRATYLEDTIKCTIQRTLPSASLSVSARWEFKGETFETDLLGQIDRVVLIIEAKSGALTVQGLRGAPERVRRHVQDLVVRPAEQSARLEQLIWQAKAGDKAAIATTTHLGLKPKEVDTVIRISVTLEEFSMMSIAERELKAAGWVPPSLRLAPTLNITDLQCVAEILHEPVYFLHYFAERERNQKEIKLIGDELDLLGLYLETGFNYDERKLEGNPLVTTGLSQRVDHYFNSLDAGITVQKPRPKIHRALENIVHGVQNRMIMGWTTIALDLLRVGNLDEQGTLFRKIKKLSKRVRKTYRDPKHICSYVVIPPAHREAFAIFYVYPQVISARRYEVAEELAGRQLAQAGRSRCVVVGKMIEAWNYPYSFVAVYNNPVLHTPHFSKER